jgi:hypothetical protein
MFDFWLVFITFVVPGLFFSIIFFKIHEFKLAVVDMMVWAHVFIILVPSIVFLVVEDRENAFRFYLAAAMGTLLLPLGALIGQLLFPLTEQKRLEFRYAPVKTNPLTDANTLRVMAVLLAICTVSVLLLAVSTSQYPLKALFSGSDVLLVKSLRRETGESSSFINDLTLWTLAPVLFVTAILYWRNAKTLSTKVFLLACMIVPFLNNSYSGRKTPVATMFLLGLIATFIASQRKPQLLRFSMRKMRLFIFFGIVIIGYPLSVFMFLPAGTTYDFWELMRVGIFDRIFLKPADNTYAAFLLFPETYEFTRFFDIGKIASLLGAETLHVSSMISFSYHGTTENSPPVSVGVAYYQHSWPGVVIISLLVGMVLKISENIFVSSVDKTPFSIALYALLVNGAIRISWGEYHSVFMTEALVPVFVMIAIITYTQRPAVMVPRLYRQQNV